MVRRGSTVRVRQRASEKPRISGASSWSDFAGSPGCSAMEHFMELSVRRRSRDVVTCDNATAARRANRLGMSPELPDEADELFRFVALRARVVDELFRAFDHGALRRRSGDSYAASAAEL